MHRYINVGAAALLVMTTAAGCAMTEGVGTESTRAVERTASAAPTTTPTPTIDDYAACAKFGGRLEDTQTVVGKIVADGTGSTLDWELLADVATDLHDADGLASPKMKGYLAPYSGVVFTLEAIRAGTLSGDQNLDTGAYRDSVAPLLSYCADDVEWSVND